MAKQTTNEQLALLLRAVKKNHRKYEWAKQRRQSQLPPEKWSVWLIMAGRGWGKTRTGAETVRSLVYRGLAKRVALIGRTSVEARQIMIEGDSGLLNILPRWQLADYYPSLRKLFFANGAIATCYSGEEPNQLRGGEHDLAWCDELASWQYSQRTWDNLMLCLRLSKSPKVVITTTPRPNQVLNYLLQQQDDKIIVTRGNTYENSANLSAEFLAYLKQHYGYGKLAEQEIFAKYSNETKNSLWTKEKLDEGRRATAPHLTRIVVGIDPAVNSKNESDETGIIVVGQGADEKSYVLADLSGKYTPSQWAEKTLFACRNWSPDLVVCETNQGGELLKQNLRGLPSAVPYKGVRAVKSKYLRSEPIADLYARQLVHHVGCFTQLEKQMTSWTEGAFSPDRIDALTLALTELLTLQKKKQINLRII